MNDEGAAKILKRIWYAIMVLFVTVLLMVPAGMIWSNRAAEHAENEAKRALRESEQAWCEILNSISTGQQANPPTTAAGKDFARRISNLINRFDC